MTTWGEFDKAESLTDFERRHLGEILVNLRRRGDESWGGQRAAIKLTDMLESLRDEAYRIEREGLRHHEPTALRRAEVIDAACNLILAVHIEWDRVGPILRRYKERMGAHRR